MKTDANYQALSYYRQLLTNPKIKPNQAYKMVKALYPQVPDSVLEFVKNGKGKFGKIMLKNNPRGKFLLFSYGSNNPEQLAQRLERNVEVISAYAEGYQRVYRGWSQRWGGGVASLIKRQGSTCYGLVCVVDNQDIKKMDVYEGFPQSYRREVIKVMVEGKPEKAVVYISNNKEKNSPSVKYLKAVFKTVSTFWDVNSYKAFDNNY